MFISFLYFLAVYDRIKRLRENPEFKTTLGINLGKNKTSKVLAWVNVSTIDLLPYSGLDLNLFLLSFFKKCSNFILSKIMLPFCT